jgi:hypothetical protein
VAAASITAARHAGAADAQRYGEHFTEWLRALRADLAGYHPRLPVAMAVMSDWRRAGTSWSPHMGTIRQQQQALQLPGVAKADMQGVEFLEEEEQPDGGHAFVHLTKNGAAALGTALAHAHFAALVADASGAGACYQPGDVASVQAAARAGSGGGSSTAPGSAATCAGTALQSRQPAATTSSGGCSLCRQPTGGGGGGMMMRVLGFAAFCWLSLA